MAVVEINPVRLDGPWHDGWALERRHTIGSVHTGTGPTGHPIFDTTYSPLGHLVFLLKNRGQDDAVESIADTAANFVLGAGMKLDLIVPVPPSSERANGKNPTFMMVTAIGARLGLATDLEAVKKVKATTALKNVEDPDERKSLLEGAFEAQSEQVEGRRVLLVDDLYRSGVTASGVATALIEAGTREVYFIAMTKTRSRR